MSLGLSDNLIKRIISALALLPFVLGLIYLGGWWFFALLAVGGAFMVFEFGQMTGVSSRASLVVASVIALMLAATVTAIDVPPAIVATLLFVGPVPILVMPPSKLAEQAVDPVKVSNNAMVGSAYVSLAVTSLAWLRTLDADGLLVIWVFFAVWAMDVGGYFAGKGIGGPKLAPKLSPKKTWAGLIGGVVLAALVSAAISWLFGLWTPLMLALAGGVVAVVSQMGDLYESAIKRHMHVKDSGQLIPGHGGILDRVDGLIFAAPFVAFVLALSQLLGAG